VDANLPPTQTGRGASRRQRDIAVIIVDDHAVVADALAALLDSEPGIRVVGRPRSIAELDALKADRVDVVLMDYQFPDGSTGADGTRIAKRRWPRARVVIVSGLTDDGTVIDTIRAGADGYFAKDRPPAELVDAVRAAHAGATLLPPAFVAELVARVEFARAQRESARRPEPLSRREQAVLELLAQGWSTDRITRELFITRNTLRSHVARLLEKLDAQSRIEAVAIGIRAGLVRPPSRADWSGDERDG